MTKVECPGPGFKGLKWKWIQDHAKEQQEREKDSVSHPPVQPSAQQLNQQGQAPQQDGAVSGPLLDRGLGGHPGSEAQCQRASSPSEQLSGVRRQSGGGSSQQAQSAQASKAVVGQHPSGSGPLPTVTATQHAQPDSTVRCKTEQVDKAGAAAPGPAPAAPLVAAVAGVVSSAESLAAALPSAASPAVNNTQLPAATKGSAAMAGTGAAAGALPCAVALSDALSPSVLPVASNLGRKPTDALAEAHAPMLSPTTATAAPPSVPAAVAVPATQPAAAPASSAQQPPATAAASAAATAPTAPAAASAQPATAASGVSAAAPAATGTAAASTAAARVRLPPARAPSAVLPIAKVKGGDDFESMFTPLSSLPVAKAETPREGACGATSRAGSLVLGSQAATSGAAAGGGGGGAAVGSTADAGGLGGERKVLPLKKVSRLPECRTGGSQPSSAEPADADHGPSTARSRTPAAQAAPAVPSIPSKETAASASAAGGASRAQPQPHGHPSAGQGHQQQQGQPATSQQQQQRPSGAKHAVRDTKEGARGREQTDAAASGSAAAPQAGGSGPQAAATGAAAASGRAMAAERAAGGTSGHGGGDAGDRKRPRTDAPKPKANPSTAGGDHATLADSGLPYMETLADRIKRAKRTTTSSSDQEEGPHSLGNSAERPHGQETPAAHVGGGSGDAADGDGGPPRPTASAEAQSRGTEAIHASASNRQARGGGTGGGERPSSKAAGGGGGGGGSSSAAAAKQQQRQQPTHRDVSSGRGDEASGAPGTTNRGAEKGCEQQQPHPTGNTLRTSGGGAATDSSCGAGGGGGPPAPQRVAAAPVHGKAPSGQGPSAAGAAGTKRPADAQPARRPGGPPAKLPRTDPQLPRPHSAPGLERRSGSGAAAGTADGAANGGRAAGSLPPPAAAGKPPHRSGAGSSPGAKAEADVHAPGSGVGAGVATGAAAGSGRSPPAPPPPRPGRVGDADMPAAGSCKGPVAGSRGSKDGMGDKGAYGPRGGGGGGGAAGGGGGAAATTTTEPKTDSDTRTSRMVECFFEFDQACRILGGSASISGLGSSGSLQGLPGVAAARQAAGSALRGAGAGGTSAAPQHLDLGKIRSFKELWTQLAALYDGALPDEMDSKIIYLDEEGDWIMVTPDEPWSSVAATATKVLVTNRT